MLGAFDRNIIVMFHAIARTRPFRAYVKRKKGPRIHFVFVFIFGGWENESSSQFRLQNQRSENCHQQCSSSREKKSVSEQGQIFPFFLDALLWQRQQEQYLPTM